jgi:hypothetical protein
MDSVEQPRAAITLFDDRRDHDVEVFVPAAS